MAWIPTDPGREDGVFPLVPGAAQQAGMVTAPDEMILDFEFG